MASWRAASRPASKDIFIFLSSGGTNALTGYFFKHPIFLLKSGRINSSLQTREEKVGRLLLSKCICGGNNSKLFPGHKLRGVALTLSSAWGQRADLRLSFLSAELSAAVTHL